jgi:hypothetical protein
MIKKLSASFLVVLYLITATGFALNLHYCCSQITSVTVNSPAQSRSGLAMCKMKCCRDKHIVVKVKDAHQAEATSFLSKTMVVCAAKTLSPAFTFSPRSVALAKKLGKDPPDFLANQPVIYLKNCVFRI